MHKYNISTFTYKKYVFMIVLMFAWMRVCVCVCAQEMGIIGPNNQLPRRRTGRGHMGLQSALFDKEDDLWTENAHMTSAADGRKQFLLPVSDAAKISEALSLFPQPKSLLTRVVQVATSSNRIRVCSWH